MELSLELRYCFGDVCSIGSLISTYLNINILKA